MGDQQTLEEIQEEFLQAQCQQVLDSWSHSAARPAEVVENAAKHYHRIHVAMLQTLSNAAALEGRVAELSEQLQRIQAQQAAVAAAEAGGFNGVEEILDKFQDDKNRAAEQAATSEDRAQAVGMQLAAMAQLRDDLTRKIGEMEDDRRAELAPQIKAMQEEIDEVKEQLHIERLKAQAAQKDVAAAAARLEAAQLQIKELGGTVAEQRAEAEKEEKMPQRCRREADNAVSALRTLQHMDAELAGRVKELAAAWSSWEQQGDEVLEAQEAAMRAGEKLRTSVAQKERAADDVQKDIEMARLDTERHMADRVTLDLELEKRGEQAKREQEVVKSEQRSRDVALRRLKTAENEVKHAEGHLPPLESAAANLSFQIGSLQRTLKRDAEARAKLQKELEALVEEVAKEKNLTELQAALVKASLQDVHALDEECAEVRAMVSKREKLAQDMASQRDAAGRQVTQWVAKLREALDGAELRDEEVQKLKEAKKKGQAHQKELRGLCELMSEQMDHFQAVCKSAEAAVKDLEEKVAAAQEQLRTMEGASEVKSKDIKALEKERSAAESQRALLGSQLAAVRRERAGTLEQVDTTSLEVQRLKRTAEEGKEAKQRLLDSKAAAKAAKEAAQQVLLERDDEICRLYEQSDACQALMEEGSKDLMRCEDDIRMLQLEVAELQRKLFATHKTAPDVTTYDRNIANLKAEVLRARREADHLSMTLEDPNLTPDRWRVLPGPIPSQEDLAGRIAQIDGKITARLNQIVQKDVALDELQRLIDSLVQKAASSHDGAFQISMQMNECQHGLQVMTRRMMATVSELALYQALSMKFAADKEQLQAQLAAAWQALAEGRPPTANAAEEFARQERDRAAQAEVRAQAAELRRLRDAGLLGQAQSTASPRPHAYLPAVESEDGLPRPFLAPFQPFKPYPMHPGRKQRDSGRSSSVSPTPSALLKEGASGL